MCAEDRQLCFHKTESDVQGFLNRRHCHGSPAPTEDIHALSAQLVELMVVSLVQTSLVPELGFQKLCTGTEWNGKKRGFTGT